MGRHESSSIRNRGGLSSRKLSTYFYCFAVLALSEWWRTRGVRGEDVVTKKCFSVDRGRLGLGRRACRGHASRSGRGGRLGFFGLGRRGGGRSRGWRRGRFR